MYKWAILWGKVARNPMDRVPRPIQQPGRYIEVFTEPEVAALTSLELRDGALMTVLFDAGLRKAEARKLRAAGRSNGQRESEEDTFHRWWVRCLEAAEVPYRNPHTTRHTFATRWLQLGGR